MPKIKLGIHIAILLCVCLIGAISLAFKVKGSIFSESVNSGLLVLTIMSIYYFVMIYHGVRYDNGVVKWKWKNIPIGDTVKDLSSNGIDIGGVNFFDFGDNFLTGILAVLASILIGILLAFIIVFLLWIGINIAGYTVVLLWIPMYIFIKYGVRLALVNVAYAKGKIFKSLFMAIFHGSMAGLAMCLVTAITEVLVRKL